MLLKQAKHGEAQGYKALSTVLEEEFVRFGICNNKLTNLYPDGVMN